MLDIVDAANHEPHNRLFNVTDKSTTTGMSRSVETTDSSSNIRACVATVRSAKSHADIADPANDQHPEPSEDVPIPLEISFPHSPTPSSTTGPTTTNRLPPEIQFADANEADESPANVTPFRHDAPRAQSISSAPLLVAAEPFDTTRHSPVSSVSSLPLPDTQNHPNQSQFSDASENDEVDGSLSPSSRHQFIPSPVLEDVTNNNLDFVMWEDDISFDDSIVLPGLDLNDLLQAMAVYNRNTDEPTA